MTPNSVAVPADRRGLDLDRVFAGEISLRAAIARKTDSAPPRTVCAWCPDFDPEDARPGDTHGMCEPCYAREHADLDRLEANAATSPIRKTA